VRDLYMQSETRPNFRSSARFPSRRRERDDRKCGSAVLLQMEGRRRRLKGTPICKMYPENNKDAPAAFRGDVRPHKCSRHPRNGVGAYARAITAALSGNRLAAIAALFTRGALKAGSARFAFREEVAAERAAGSARTNGERGGGRTIATLDQGDRWITSSECGSKLRRCNALTHRASPNGSRYLINSKYTLARARARA